jgi:hypothetical protein
VPGLKAKSRTRSRHVGISLVHVAGLHGQKFFPGRNAQSFFQHLDKMQQLLRLVVADIINLVFIAGSSLGWGGLQSMFSMPWTMSST